MQVEEATEKGHMKQSKQGAQSTKGREEESPQQEQGKKTQYLFATIVEMKGMVYSNLTGKFPRVSSRGMRYIMVFYCYNGNCIKGIPIKNQTEGEFKRAYKHAY
eukprot:2022836-Ditylum_brightwellii.AAC.1